MRSILIALLLLASPAFSQTLQEQVDDLSCFMHDNHGYTPLVPGLCDPPPASIPPDITSAPVASVQEGGSYIYNVTATGDAPITYSLDAGPAGMSFSGNTLSWATPAEGGYSVTIRAANGNAPDDTQSFTLTVSAPTPPPTGGTLVGTSKTECLNQLTSVSGWCKIDAGSHINDSVPTVDTDGNPVVAGSKVWGGSGPYKEILESWSTGCQLGNKLYFAGGGHAGYGGNDVRSFDMGTGQWKLVKAPSALTFLMNWQGRLNWNPPENAPPSSHTYDGLICREDTQTIVMLSDRPYDGASEVGFPVPPGDELPVAQGGKLLVNSNGTDNVGGVYEFNPLDTTSINGLAPKTWRRVNETSWPYPRSVRVPDGRMFISASGDIHELSSDYTATPKVQPGIGGGQWDGGLVYDAFRDMIWMHAGNALYGFHYDGYTDPVSQTFSPGFHEDRKMFWTYYLQPAENHEPILTKTLAIDSNTGTMYAWDGVNTTYKLNPVPEETPVNSPAVYYPAPGPVWEKTVWGSAGPQVGKLKQTYAKFAELKDHPGYFFAVSSDDGGVWIFKP